MNRRLWLIYGIVLVDVVAGSAINPVLPEFVQELGRPQVWLSVATALFLGVQFFSAPLLGKLSDTVGRRPLIITSTVGTAVANALLLPIRPLFLFVNRFGDGLTNGMFATARSAVTDLSPREDVLKNIGLVSTIISLGNVLGPMASGLLLTLSGLTDQQARMVVWLVIGLAGLNVLLSLFVKETCADTKAIDRRALRSELLKALNVRRQWQTLNEQEELRPGLRLLTMLTLLFALAQGYYTYFVAYVSAGPLRFNPTQTSYFFIFFGGLSTLSNFLFFKYVADRVNKRKAAIAFAWIGVGLFISYANIGRSITILYVTAAVDSVSVGLLSGLLNGLVAQHTNDDDRGEVMGITQALTGIASLCTTLIYGALSAIHINLPFYWFALSLFVLGVLALRVKEDPAEERLATE